MCYTGIHVLLSSVFVYIRIVVVVAVAARGGQQHFKKSPSSNCTPKLKTKTNRQQRECRVGFSYKHKENWQKKLHELFSIKRNRLNCAHNKIAWNSCDCNVGATTAKTERLKRPKLNHNQKDIL